MDIISANIPINSLPCMYTVRTERIAEQFKTLMCVAVAEARAEF